MQTESGATFRCVRGYAFEEVLDGYFPIAESVRQMMERQNLAEAMIMLFHAPVLDVKELAPDAPVPMHLPKNYAGMVDQLTLAVRAAGDGYRIRGRGEWFWIGERDGMSSLSTNTRLGEPAFIRGVGWGPDVPRNTEIALVYVDEIETPEASLGAALRRLGWPAGKAWGWQAKDGDEDRIGQSDGGTLAGHALSSSAEGVAVTGPDPVSSRWNYLLMRTDADAVRT